MINVKMLIGGSKDNEGIISWSKNGVQFQGNSKLTVNNKNEVLSFSS